MNEIRTYIQLSAIFIILAAAAVTDHLYRKIYWWESLLILLTAFIPENTNLIWRSAETVILILCLIIGYIITKSASGGGDIKLYCALTFTLGLPASAVIMMTVAILSFIYLKIRKLEKGTEVPVACFTLPAYTLYIIICILI